MLIAQTSGLKHRQHTQRRRPSHGSEQRLYRQGQLLWTRLVQHSAMQSIIRNIVADIWSTPRMMLYRETAWKPLWRVPDHSDAPSVEPLGGSRIVSECSLPCGSQTFSSGTFQFLMEQECQCSKGAFRAATIVRQSARCTTAECLPRKTPCSYFSAETPSVAL